MFGMTDGFRKSTFREPDGTAPHGLDSDSCSSFIVNDRHIRHQSCSFCICWFASLESGIAFPTLHKEERFLMNGIKGAAIRHEFGLHLRSGEYKFAVKVFSGRSKVAALVLAG